MSQQLPLLDRLRADVIGTPSAEQLLGMTLDLLPVKVVIVNAEARIVHSNVAAESMLSARNPICSRQGVLSGNSAATTEALVAAIKLAVREGGRIGQEVPLSCRDGRVAIAHVRYLGPLLFCAPTRLSNAVALFITEPEDRPSPPLAALAQLYELTPAELRVVGQIASGKNRKAAAVSLGLADSTVKTHLDHIFLKTATSDQIELSRLVDRLSWPSRPEKI